MGTKAESTINPVLESLFERKSVRAYEKRDISDEDKRNILLAAMAAPSAGNQQLYTILDITDQTLKDRLAVSCDNQPFIAKAPMVLLFCADFQKWYDSFLEGGSAPRTPGVGDMLLSFADSFIAAQNAVTAAESLGIGSCYIGDILEKCEEHRQLLRLPQYVVPAAMLVFGYPTAQQKTRKKPERLALEHIVHENGYRHMEGSELRNMFQKECGEQTYEQWSDAFCERKYNSDFSREMTRSVAVYLEAFR
jgi:nitroreductase